ncbi:MAG: hypothetical protein CFE43_21295 [Burkholderiales bacterium PBB3]|nr:MAG: hypothetical protein CFE43_21295 [Burkholderiales bacterium PBB3]
MSQVCEQEVQRCRELLATVSKAKGAVSSRFPPSRGQVLSIGREWIVTQDHVDPTRMASEKHF